MVLFDRIAIIGFGLIGSSIGRVIKKHGLCKKLVVSDKITQGEGIWDEYYDKIDEWGKHIDLFILATPVCAYSKLAGQIATRAKAGAIITDVGSVKSSVVSNIEKATKGWDVSFVGSHPIAGIEKSGASNGSAELFAGKKCIITPSLRSTQDAIEKIIKLWEVAGMDVEVMTPEKHDKIMAVISHLPHLLAFCMVQLTNKFGDISYAGTGFKDFTRIAGSDPDVWQDIFLSNKEEIMQITQKYIAELTAFKEKIQNEEGVHEYIKEAQKIRSNLTK